MSNNTVELIGHYGSDELIALSAWTSTSRDLDDAKKDRIPALLKTLAENGHHTPFEKSSLHFLVTSDIATHIHLLKHRIGVSTNAESARYKELKEDNYYIPEDWKDIEIKSGSVEEKDTWADALEAYTEYGNVLYHKCLDDLTPVLGRARAKESARFFKTYNSQITCDIMFNWRSFYHFLELRNKPSAQKEIKELAQSMLELIKSIPNNPFQYTIEAFNL